jgi:hypothetical protein
VQTNATTDALEHHEPTLALSILRMWVFNPCGMGSLIGKGASWVPSGNKRIKYLKRLGCEVSVTMANKQQLDLTDD